MNSTPRVDVRPLIVTLIALVLVAGCGGGGHKPQGPKQPPAATVVAPNVKPTPNKSTVVPSPSATHAVLCLSYAMGGSNADFHAMEAAHITGVVDYQTWPPDALCHRLAGTHLKLVRALYYGDGATTATLEPVTQAAVRDNALCPERLLWTYPWDESPIRGISKAVVEASLTSVNRAFPGVPSFIAMGEQGQDKLPLYAGLSLRGQELYARRWLDPKNLHARLDRLNGQPLVLIVRAWIDTPRCCGGAFGAWTDAETAQLVRLAMHEAQQRPNVVALAFYVASGDGNDQSVQWLAMPLTRAAITEVCR